MHRCTRYTFVFWRQITLLFQLISHVTQVRHSQCVYKFWKVKDGISPDLKFN